VADEVEEVAAVGFDGVIRQQGITDPGDQRRRGWVGGAAAGLQGASQEGGDLLGRRGVTVEEVAALRDQGRAARRQDRQAGLVGSTCIVIIDG
jgi:hypothetical protein